MRGTNPSLTQTLINGHNIAAGDWFVLDQTGTWDAASATPCCPRKSSARLWWREFERFLGGRRLVAGSVDIITRKPSIFRNTFTLEASAGAVYADLPSKTDPQVSASAPQE